MGFSCGIVGMPNAGKSTLFNALTATATAQTANYPFCTIDPNEGVVAVPDHRLEKLAASAGSQKIIPTQLAFVDIAGLIKGASQGEGLGNQFLGHIREVDIILHVVRCFHENVTESIDPIGNIEIIETELMLSDLQSLEKQITSRKKRNEDKDVIAIMEKAAAILSNGSLLRNFAWDIKEEEVLKALHMLTTKPMLYVANISEQDIQSPGTNPAIKSMQEKVSNLVYVCAGIESEIVMLDKGDQDAFISDAGLANLGIASLINTCYSMLSLYTFFTVGPKEARAWTIKKGAIAPEAAGEIHTDFQRGFISAEVIAYEDYINYKSTSEIKSAGKMRLEGKEYIVKDGDVMLFRFNV